MNSFLDVLVGLIDMLESALLEALGERIVFFLSDIVVGFVNEFERAVETAAPIEASVNRRMIVQILAVIEGQPNSLCVSAILGMSGGLPPHSTSDRLVD